MKSRFIFDPLAVRDRSLPSGALQILVILRQVDGRQSDFLFPAPAATQLSHLWPPPVSPPWFALSIV